MRKIFALFIMCIGLQVINAQVLLDETFEYTAADIEDVASTIWLKTGTAPTGETQVMTKTITSPALTYETGGKEYIHSGAGKKVEVYYKGSNISNDPENANNYRNYRGIGQSVNSGAVYLSFLYQPGEQTQTQSEVIGFMQNTNNGPRLWAGKGKNTNKTKDYVTFGVTTGDTGSDYIAWGSNDFPINISYFIVLKHEFTENKTTIYVNPIIEGENPLTEEVNTNDPAAGASKGEAYVANKTNRTSLNNISFRVGGNNAVDFQISGIRVSTSWADAVAKKVSGLPQLNAPVVGTATNPGAQSFTANWTATAGATGYIVNVYDSNNEFITSKTIDDGSATSIEVDGLWANTQYTYTVIAKGDNENSSNSEESAHSAPITTNAGVPAINIEFSNSATWETNGLILSSATYNTASTTNKGIKGDEYTNRIAISKGGNITLPIVSSLMQVEVHLVAGTVGNGIVVTELNPVDQSWTPIDEQYSYPQELRDNGTIDIYTISHTNSSSTQLRIENPTNGSVYIYKIVVRPTNPVILPQPVAKEPTDITNNSFTANWEEVENATGYEVKVYRGTTLFKTEIIAGPTTTSCSITELAKSTAYYYKVLALGDNDINYTTSFFSNSVYRTPRVFLTDGGWETICLPYSVSNIIDEKGVKVTGYKLIEFDGVTVNGTDEIINFTAASSIEAGKPYLIAMPTDKASNTSYLLSDENIVETKTEVTVNDSEGKGYTFQGTFTKITGEENVLGKYVLNNDGLSFVKAANTTEIPANGAYFIIPDSPNLTRKLTIKYDDGDTTGMASEEVASDVIYSNGGVVYINSMQAQTVNVYSIDGCLILQKELNSGENTITGLAKGMYLINNSKVIVK